MFIAWTQVDIINNRHRLHNEKQSDGEDFVARQSFDNISLSSLGPNATTIRVSYKPFGGEQQFELNEAPTQTREPCKMLDEEETSGSSSGSKLGESIDEMRKRLDKISTHQTRIPLESTKNQEKKRFEYETIIANVQPTPIVLSATNKNTVRPRQHVVDAYNVKVIEHNSPFHTQGLPLKSVNELSNSIARLEMLSGATNGFCADNNNDKNFDLSDFVKKPPQPTTNVDLLDDDNNSMSSSCSLKSSRTYNIRSTAGANGIESTIDVVADEKDDLNDEKDFPVEVQRDLKTNEEDNNEVTFEYVITDNDEVDEKKPAAWIFDITNGSSTAIKAPPRPKKPDSPKIDSRTEELAESKGGRSYYIELVEQNGGKNNLSSSKKEPKLRQRPSSIDSLYSRWNSQGTLTTSSSSNTNQRTIQRLSSPTKSPSLKVLSGVDNTRKSRQLKPASLLDSNNRPIGVSGSTNNLQPNLPRQLQLNSSPLSNRSKSSSCLVGSTRTTKYSIYGGLRKPNCDNKPVPRLSYSRAIGPKSQRKFDSQTKTPSRYLKMK